MSYIYTYCGEVPAEGELPPDVAVVARVVSAWQLEDPRLFEQEFQRSLPALCRLDPEEFQVLLPCLQEVHDWHLTPALAAVLQTAFAAVKGCEDDLSSSHLSGEVWRQCALMLAEVALDAAAAVPVASSVLASGPQLPRPVQAADPENPGV